MNRLDQRIGRLDRYAVRAEPAEVVVFTEPASEWVTAHIRLIHDGIGVLSTSVSTVQRLLSSVLAALVEQLLPRGVQALQINVEELRRELENEQEGIDLLEEIESVESATGFPDDSFAELIDYEAQTESLRNAVKRLTFGVGSLDVSMKETRDGVARFTNAQGVGLALDDARDLERLLTPKAFERAVAVEEPGVLPFRIGDPFVTWLQDYLLADERGRASAIVRPVQGLTTPTLWLRCEFLIEFDPGIDDSTDRVDQRRLARRGEVHLQPLRIETWTDGFGAAPKETTESILNLPFDFKRDEVLRGRCWGPVLEALPTWSASCRTSVGMAWQEVRESPQLSAAIETAMASSERESSRRLAILEARALRLPSEAERTSARLEFGIERDTAEALLRGIATPTIRMVTCGACVLWPEENF
ncbi:MAG: hypothetical protein F2840_18060 [Actinobacteria bacterium]|uniref:Unannotated protein n=1 Tax=freshwater metagenome TaxID=449393 RepID=A0A6J7M8J3_9ZZZZ|nr:hypothetical protein [Actinomycetota bacterium]